MPSSYKQANHGTLNELIALDQAIFAEAAYSHGGWIDELKAAHVLISYDADLPVGFISVARTGDDAEVRKIAVLEASRRRGIAQFLLQSAVQTLGKVERLLIDVADDNQAAIAFYANNGFIEIARRRKYYSNGADAIVMAALGDALYKIMSAPSAK